MAEETEGSGSGGAGTAGGVDPITLALSRASRDKADALLVEQTKYLRQQRAGLEEEQRLQLSHLRLRRFSDYAKGALEITIAMVVLILIVGLGFLVVQARQAKGLVAEPIKIPSDYAARGLDGTVLAQELLDKLNGIAVRAEHNDLRVPDTIVGSWTNEANVQIPTTGISLGEFKRLLYNWLGHQTYISGELVREAGGIALTVRAGNNPGETFAGPEAHLDKLLDKAATSLFRQTQPFAYSNSLSGGKPDPDAIISARQLAEFGPRDQRVYGYLAWASALEGRGDVRGAVMRFDQAVSLAPDDPYPYYYRWPADAQLGHKEILLADGIATVRLLHANLGWIRPDAAAEALPQTESEVAAFTGAYLTAAKLAEIAGNYDLYDYNKFAPLQIADYYARAHDTRKARAILATNPQFRDIDALTSVWTVADTVFPSVALRAEIDDWTGAAEILGSVDRQSQQHGRTLAEIRHTFLWPWLAYAWARTGNVKGGEELIAMTPQDCTVCLEFRGRIAAVAGDYRNASYWFDRAVKDAPSVPFAIADWGEMLMHRGDYDAAIVKFTLANQKGPHFADPLEMWGETLMLKNRSDLALAKFEDANRYAPNWGRLHMKWGDALGYVGRKGEARAQYRIASTLDLSVADKVELARDMRS